MLVAGQRSRPWFIAVAGTRFSIVHVLIAGIRFSTTMYGIWSTILHAWPAIIIKSKSIFVVSIRRKRRNQPLLSVASALRITLDFSTVFLLGPKLHFEILLLSAPS
jgi:hypothetical protein